MPKSSLNTEQSQIFVDKEAGRKANLTGKDFEDTVELRIQQKGYTLWNKKGEKPSKWYAKQYNAGNNLLGTPLRVDFIVDGRLIIECKWQSSNGSVDEKYPWTMMNLAHLGLPSIMVLEGGGCRPAMVNFLKEFANSSETVTLCNLSEFYQLDL